MAGSGRAAFAIGAVVVAGGACAAACYSPTQVTITVTTDQPCGTGGALDTEIYVASPAALDGGNLAPSASVKGCRNIEPSIGDLTVVPSGSRDESFEVKVVAGVGVPASACGGEAISNCIVARRRVGFREHKSLTLEIKLSERCAGVPCGVDRTCDLGTCVPLVDCIDRGCPRERGDLPVDVLDAGPDAPLVTDAAVDAPADAPAKCGPVAETVILGQAIVGQLWLDQGDFVYANGTGEIRRVPRRGGGATLVRIVPGLRTVAAGDAGVGWVAVNGMQVEIGYLSVAGIAQLFNAPPDSRIDALAFSGTAIVGFAAPALNGSGRTLPFAVNTSFGSGIQLPTPLMETVPEIAVDGAGTFYGVVGSATVVRCPLSPTKIPTMCGTLSNRSPRPDIAIVGQTLYVALDASAAGSASGIHAIDQAALAESYAKAPIVPNALPRSMAADNASLYYLAGDNLWRIGLPVIGSPMPTKLAVVPAGADRLQVDDQCVYWVEEAGARIMRRAK